MYSVVHDVIRQSLSMDNEKIKSYSHWKPMHLQPMFQSCRGLVGELSAGLFAKGLCFPAR
jgi:hypothetical protein